MLWAYDDTPEYLRHLATTFDISGWTGSLHCCNVFASEQVCFYPAFRPKEQKHSFLYTKIFELEHTKRMLIVSWIGLTPDSKAYAKQRRAGSEYRVFLLLELPARRSAPILSLINGSSRNWEQRRRTYADSLMRRRDAALRSNLIYCNIHYFYKQEKNGRVKLLP